MKIISVACFNLNSLRGRQPHRLDFEAAPLEGCGLFAISGPTGAGKTTLLDAITLALYGETPRQKNGLALSSHGAVDSWAEVVYEVGAGRFLARWKMRRSFGKVGGNATITMHVAPHPPKDGDWQMQKQTESIAKNEELTGMSYEQFTRSVLLAQGGFAEFLKAKDDDRADLLERMTGTGIYKELSQNAHERHRAEAARQQQLQDRIGAVRLLSGEELAQKTSGLTETTQQVSQAQQTADHWRQQLAWHERRAELTAKAARAAPDVAAAETALAARAADLARLAAHEPAERFALPWRDAQTARRQAEATEAERRQTTDQLASAQQRQTEAAAAVATAQHAADRAAADLAREQPALRHALAQLPNLQTLAQHTTTAHAAWQASQHAAADVGRQHYRLTQQTAADRAELTALKIWLHASARDGELAGVLVQLENLLAQRQRTKEQFDARHQEHQLADSALQQAKAEKTDHYKNEQKTARELAGLRERLSQQHAQFAGLLSAAQARQQELDRALAAARRAEGDCYATLIGKQLFRDHAARLHGGHECPLCGSLEHPVRGRHIDASDEALNQLENQFVELQEKTALADRQHKQNEELLTLLGGPPAPAAAPDPAAQALPLADAARSARLLLRDLAAAPAQLAQLAGDEKRHQEKAAAARAKQAQAQAQAVGLATQLADLKREGLAASAEIERIAAGFGVPFDRSQAAELLGRLRQRAQTFREKQVRLAALEPALAGSAATLAALATQQAELLTETETRAAAHAAAEATRRACAADIAAAHPGFAGPQPALAHWEAAADLARETLAARQAAEREAAAAAERLASRERDQAARRDQHQATAAALLDQLRREMPAASLPPDPAALDGLLLPDAERDHLRGLRQRLETALSSARSYQQRCQQELAQLEAEQLSQEPADTVRLHWQTAHQLHLDLVKQHTLLENEILTEQANQLRYTELGTALAAQRAETLRWKALHDLIGSADGTRFSRFAQGLTLARLVGLANHHLRQFSDRYQLRRRDATSLALLVADAYDECVREVSTLSGGETFLASLALALGLSELASNAARIDSLFIDEGFGTLDAETLHVALAALGSLRDRGKTIGIITHVDLAQLEGHIDTRVLVERVGQGSSRLRVLPEPHPLAPPSLETRHPMGKGD